MAETSITSLDSKTQRQVENARFALDRGNLEYSIRICMDVLRKHPECLPVRKLLRAAQITHFRSKNKLVAKLVGTLSGAPSLIAASSQVKKNPAKAMDAAEHVLSKDPTNASALKVLSQAAKELELPETVVFAMEGIRDQSPNSVPLLLQLSEAYVAAKQSDEALRCAERVLELKPGHAEAQSMIKTASVSQSINRGNWESENASYRDMLKSKEEALSLEQSSKVVASEDVTGRLIDELLTKVQEEPENIDHYRKLVRNYEKLGDYEQGLHWLAKARSLPSGSTDTTLEKQESDFRVKILKKKLAEKTKLLAAAPDSKELEAEVEALNRELAELRLKEAKGIVDRYPNDAVARFDYGKLLYELGDIDQAVQQFQFAQRNPKMRVEALSYLGSCFKRKKQFDLAVEQYCTVKNEQSDMTEFKKEIVYELADCYEQMGDMDKAIAEYKVIYSIDIGYRDVAEKIDAFYSKS